MLYINGTPTDLRQGLTRRDALRIGFGAGFGSLLLPRVGLGSEEQAAPANRSASGSFGKAKSVIILYLFGGPSHIDTLDMKPNAPADMRGEFKPISTNLPGVQIVEHLPKLARHMDKVALVRSMTHGDKDHGSSAHAMLTGRLPSKIGEIPPSADDFPNYGAVLSQLKPRTNATMPPFVSIPWTMRTFVNLVPGQTGGFLGHATDPFRLEAPDNEYHRFAPPPSALPAEIDAGRFSGRASLYGRIAQSLDKNTVAGEMGQLYDRAFRLITSQDASRALDLDKEPPALRERYGMNLWGQSTLMARRLVEAGVPAVTVYWPDQISADSPRSIIPGIPPWDTHGEALGRGNFKNLKRHLLPPLDISLTALLEDLTSRGMLEQTLVVVMGEFGRTPKITQIDGREHYGQVFSILLAGGGIRGGQVYGASDRHGAFPLTDPVTPAALAATIYHCMGVKAESVIHDRLNRPLAVADGEPVMGLLV